MAIDYLDGGIVIKAGSIEMYHEMDAKVGEGVEDLEDDDLVVVYAVCDGSHARVAIDEYDEETWGDEFNDEREAYDL